MRSSLVFVNICGVGSRNERVLTSFTNVFDTSAQELRRTMFAATGGWCKPSLQRCGLGAIERPAAGAGLMGEVLVLSTSNLRPHQTGGRRNGVEGYRPEMN